RIAGVGRGWHRLGAIGPRRHGQTAGAGTVVRSVAGCLRGGGSLPAIGRGARQSAPGRSDWLWTAGNRRVWAADPFRYAGGSMPKHLSTDHRTWPPTATTRGDIDDLDHTGGPHPLGRPKHFPGPCFAGGFEPVDGPAAGVDRARIHRWTRPRRP